MGFLYNRIYWDGIISVVVYSEGEGGAIVLLVYNKRAIMRRAVISINHYGTLQDIARERVYSECEKTLSKMINFIDFNYR